MARMQEIKKEGRTLFYVSHAPGSVREMCDRALVLVDGKLGFDGAVDEAEQAAPHRAFALWQRCKLQAEIAGGNAFAVAKVQFAG